MRVVNGDGPDRMCVGVLLLAAILALLDSRITYRLSGIRPRLWIQMTVN